MGNLRFACASLHFANFQLTINQHDRLRKIKPERNQVWLPVVLIAGALLGWMGVLAAGAYWAPVGEREGGDFRKLWVVAATTGGFLLLWGLVLVARQRRLRRDSADSADLEGREDASD